MVLETERKDLRKSKSAIDQLTKPVNGVSSQKNGAQFLSRPLAHNSLSGGTKIQFKTNSKAIVYVRDAQDPFDNYPTV